ncbi:hypothetical protein BDV11DRAFT_158826 [Aspergillus similis]
MGSGRILGLAWHLHRSGSSSLSFRHFIFSHVNSPFLSSLFSSPFHPSTFFPFIPLPVLLSSRLVLSEFFYTVPSKSKYLALAMSVPSSPQ